MNRIRTVTLVKYLISIKTSKLKVNLIAIIIARAEEIHLRRCRARDLVAN